MSNAYFTILFFLFVFPIFLNAQRPPKFGKISEEEKAIEKTDLAPDASAMILSDYGEIDFQGRNLAIARHTKIKIIDQGGMEEANIAIPYYAKDNIEKIFKVKAHTINISEKGKVIKTKLKKSDFFTVDLDQNWKELRFTFPGVQPGSIIEYEYVKNSKSAISLETWYFQNHLPTLKSQLNVIIAGGLDYKIVYNGNRLINKYGGENRNAWLLTDLPPLKSEPYCPNPEDYVESIRFQLARYRDYSEPSSSVRAWVNIMSSWEKLAKDILEDKDYESVLNKKKASEKILKQIISEEDSQREKIKKIYSFVQNTLEWNDKYRLSPDRNFSKILESKSANSAEINLVLVRLLQSAGFDANPVIISTKNHGLITKVYPLINQFDHVIAQVSLYKKDILMDAVSKFRPYNLLSKNDLNPLGYLLSKKDPRWVVIEYPQKTKSVVMTDLSFDEEKMNYKVSFSFYQHDAVSKRIDLYNAEDEENFILKSLLPKLEENEMILDSFSMRNQNDLEKPFVVLCYVSKELEEGLDAAYLYIDPMLKKHIEKNPFNDPNRYLPIDFILPSSEKFIFNLKIPEGYEIAEPFESARLTTNSKKGKYSFLYKDPIPGRVQVMSEFEITDPLILPNEYGAIREMFTQMIGLQSTQLVLKKK